MFLSMFKNVVIIFAFSIFAVSASAQTREVYSENDGYLNLRYGPGTKYSIIQRMYNGTQVYILKRSGHWAKIKLNSNTVGWAHRKYLVKPSAPAPVKRVYSPNDGYLNLRTGPGTKYTIIDRMHNGTTVQVLRHSGNWLKVRLDTGAVGWAYKKYLVN